MVPWVARRIVPVEVCEQRYPLLVDRFTYNFVPAGAGRYRGGFGLVREYRLLCEKAELTTTFGRHQYSPWSAAGGQEGSPNGVSVIPASQSEPALWRGKLARYPLSRDDVVRLVTGVGGGYGDPRLQHIRDDIPNGSLTDQAREHWTAA
jgi:N-methylhydantoinase B